MLFALALISVVVAAEPVPAELEVLRVASQRLAQARDQFPDAGLLPKSGLIPVIAADARAFPAKKWLAKSAAQWQAEADKAEENRYAGIVEFIDVKGDVARVQVGVELFIPSSKPSAVLCCCSATDVYRRDGKTWRFEKREEMLCS